MIETLKKRYESALQTVFGRYYEDWLRPMLPTAAGLSLICILEGHILFGVGLFTVWIGGSLAGVYRTDRRWRA